MTDRTVDVGPVHVHVARPHNPTGAHRCPHPDCRNLRTPRERWGTCCPFDPECDHSFIDDIGWWMDTPISDTEAARIAGDAT